MVAHLNAEIWWFEELNYLSAFWIRLKSQVGLWVVVSGVSIIFLLGNLRLAELGSKPRFTSSEKLRKNTDVKVDAGEDLVLPIPLQWLLPLTIAIGTAISTILFHYSRVALTYWQQDWSLPNITPPLPQPLSLSVLLHLIPDHLDTGWSIHWWLVGVVGLVIFLLVKSGLVLRILAIVFALIFGLIISGNWTRVLEYFYGVKFGNNDPLFNLDIGFYIFQLPIWKLVYFWLQGLFLYALLACLLRYLLSEDSLSQGRFTGFKNSQLRHLAGLGGALMLSLSLNRGLGCFNLVYSHRGVAYGASYTDVHIELPLDIILSVLAVVMAIALLRLAFSRTLRIRNSPQLSLLAWRLPIVLLTIYILAWSGGFLTVLLVQRFDVQPNELERERPYIIWSIAETRAAFALDKIDAKTFDPQGNLTAAKLKENELTIDNIRLWDTRPLLQANRQLQEIRLYYKFFDADIDRYTMLIKRNIPTQKVKLQKQQVIISPRELDYTKVPKEAKTWVNEHLVYTHGYGFTVSPVNKVEQGGLPTYFVRDIGTIEDEGKLYLADEVIEGTIPLGRPRIYYGELTNAYIMTSTKVKELDFPSGQDNVYNTYDGRGGIAIGGPWRRLIFAQYLKDWQMLFTKNFTPQTQLLFRRNINQRLRAIAPFLRYDRDPYFVTVETGEPQDISRGNHLYWIVDAYTTTDLYPYSDPGEGKFNYIRNPVEVVVDAYNGDVTFYASQPEEPIVKTWTKILPQLFKPLESMPLELKKHIRYPIDMFSVQSERLLTYHMKDPKVFYNREDQWQIPQEIYGSEALPVKPYHLIMKLPEEQQEEFILLHPYTPKARPNLIAWLAARSDGEQYGKLLLYEFPKQKLVFGISQIEALINQDPKISEQISLWNRQNSRAIQGNLLVIPIEKSLVYVEPLYLEAQENSVPTLVRTIVVYENKIVMAESLAQAFASIFDPDNKLPLEPAIIRQLNNEEVEKLTPP